MISSVAALRRYPGALPLDPAAERDRSIRRRINAVWGLLYLNTMTFVAGYSVLALPSKVGKGVAQGALPLAILIALTINPKLKVRPNAFLCIVGVLVADSMATAIPVPHLGTVFRTFRFAEFVFALWLLTPWWGRRDMLLFRVHLRWIWISLGSVMLGMVVSPHRAFLYGQSHRLTGAIWPMFPTQIAQYTAIATGLTILLWLGRMLSGRAALLGVIVAFSMCLLSHTRTALVALVAGLLIAGLSLFSVNARVRKFFAAIAAIVSLAVLTAAGVIVNWLARGENTQGLTTLTGRTNFWALVLNFPRTRFQEIFGFGLSNASVNGLPIDSNWMASYMQEGLIGVIACAGVLVYLFVAALFQPRGIRRALVLFIVTYVTAASITEDAFTDVSTYLLHLFVAASLLAVPA